MLGNPHFSVEIPNFFSVENPPFFLMVETSQFRHIAAGLV
jgi:hypothetical protein